MVAKTKARRRAAPKLEAAATSAIEKAAAAAKLSRAERRDLGLLTRQVITHLWQMRDDGLLTDRMTMQERAACYCTEMAISEDYGAAWSSMAAKPGFDWEAFTQLVLIILEWLERFLPLFI